MLFAVLVGGARAGTPQPPAQKAALKAIQRAAATHAIDPATAAAARAEVARAAHLIRDLPSGRREHVAVALGEFASFSGRLTQPRALALLGELKVNDAFFAKHYAPAPRADVTDEDGLVYRYFAGRCLEFHPLANFGALNARVAAGDTDGAQRLAAALVARGVSRPGGAVVWEYPFPFSGGKPGWTSGMAQAVAAQALARTAELVPDDDTALRRAATRCLPRDSEVLADLGRGRPLDQALLVRLARRPECAAAGGRVVAVLRRSHRRCRSGGARGAHAHGGGGDDPALRLRLLDVLRTARRLVAARLPAIRRPVAEAPRTDRRAFRLGGDALRGVREAAAGLQGDERLPRRSALLALEARCRDGDDRGRADQTSIALRRVAHACLVGAEARRLLRCPRQCRRLGRQPHGVRHASDRARSWDGFEGSSHPGNGSGAHSRAAAARRRRSRRRPRASVSRARSGLPTRPIRRHLAGRRR